MLNEYIDKTTAIKHIYMKFKFLFYLMTIALTVQYCIRLKYCSALY